MFGLRYTCQTVRQVSRILQCCDTGCLGQSIDTPGWPGAPQGFKNIRGAYSVTQAQPGQGVCLGH